MTAPSRFFWTGSPVGSGTGLKVSRAVVVLAAVLLAGSARADIIELSDEGVAALRSNHLVAPQAHANGKGWFLEGQIVVLRDETDQPVLPNPSKYFMFRPRPGSFTATGPDGKPTPDAKEVRLEFAWASGIAQEIDTLDDVRGLISNRDLRYRSVAETLDALLADIDPQGLLRLRKSSPAVANATIVAREGWLSNFLINGPATRDERSAEMARLRAMPHEDPLSENPIDPRLWLTSGDAAMDGLLKTLARGAKWGEAEPGLQDSCRAVAHFIADSIFVVPSDVPAGARANAMRLAKFATDARQILLRSARVGSVEQLSLPTRPGVTPPAARVVTPPDSAQPITLLDEARVALEVLATCADQPDRPGEYEAIDTLLICAAGRSDFRAAGTQRPLQPEYAADCDAIGRRAFEILQAFVTVPPAGTPDRGAAFRAELRPWLVFFDDAATAHVARAALAGAGLGEDGEIAPLLDYLFQQALFAGPAQNDVRENLIFVLKRLPAAIADAGRRERFQAEVDRRIDQLKLAVTRSQARPNTQVFLDQYAATP